MKNATKKTIRLFATYERRLSLGLTRESRNHGVLSACPVGTVSVMTAEISNHLRKKHDAWVSYVEAVRGYEWFSNSYENRCWYWCFNLPTGQRFCRNMPVWAQIELGIQEKDRVPGWADPCVEVSQ